MTRGPAQFRAGSRPEGRVHLFERPEKARELLLQFLRTPPRLVEITVAKLAGLCDYGGAHHAIFMRALRPCQPVIRVDPDREPHPSASNSPRTTCSIRTSRRKAYICAIPAGWSRRGNTASDPRLFRGQAVRQLVAAD